MKIPFKQASGRHLVEKNGDETPPAHRLRLSYESTLRDYGAVEEALLTDELAALCAVVRADLAKLCLAAWAESVLGLRALHEVALVGDGRERDLSNATSVGAEKETCGVVADGDRSDRLFVMARRETK